MFFTAAAITVAIAVMARLALQVRDDRPSAPPRSHFQEVDWYSSRAL